MPIFNRFVWRAPRIIGTGMTKLNRKHETTVTPTQLMKNALDKALCKAKLQLDDLDALIAIPSLSHPHFMEAHHFATKIGLLPKPGLILRTMDTGGASPITALLEAKRMISQEHINTIAIVGGDCVASLPTDKFLESADKGCRNTDDPNQKSPVIPHGYDTYAQYQLNKYAKYGLKREHYAMIPVLMSYLGIKHPASLMYNKQPHTLDDVLSSPQIAPVTNLLECARRADGGAAVIVASTGFVKNIMQQQPDYDVMILGGGEASGPLYPFMDKTSINEQVFSCEGAATIAYRESNLKCSDIDWFGLYDCFPITLIRAIEAVGLCKEGYGWKYIEEFYKYVVENKELNPNDFPINTHGGLLMFGAPWEVPAMYCILECVDQISKKAGNRQVDGCRRGLVYGNGGIFSHSSVAILSEPVE
eukprot:308706_1